MTGVIGDWARHATVSRRKALALAGLGTAGVAAGIALGGREEAQAHAGLVRHDEIDGQPTVYDGTGARRADSYNPTFYAELETWMRFWRANCPASWSAPLQIRYAGVHVDKAGSCAGMSGSCHSYGRAFDLRHILYTDRTSGKLVNGFNSRYDQWGNDAARRKRYWATVASLNYHFTYVLHYLFAADPSHRNHVHMDNSASGGGLGTLGTGRSTQVQSAQAALRYIWGYSTTIDGVWGSQTNAHSRAALGRIGRTGGLTTSATNWREFNKATFRFGLGAQHY